VARRRDRLTELAERLKRGNGISADVLCADLTDPADLAKVETLAGGDEALTLLINNAGFAGYQPFVSIDPQVIDDLIDIHVRTVTRLSRAVLPGMVRRRKGAVTDIRALGSVVCFALESGSAPYEYRLGDLSICARGFALRILWNISLLSPSR